MATQTKESSVLFSLHELMDLERDRIESERHQQEDRERAIAQAALTVERRRVEAEEARARAAEEAERLERERARSEAARLDAIKLAEVQRAKADADHWAKLETARQEYEHVQRLHALRSDKGKRRLVQGVVGLVALLVATGAGGVALLRQSAAETESAQAAIAANEIARRTLLAERDRADEERRRIEGDLGRTKSEVERLVLLEERRALAVRQAKIAADLNNHPQGGPPTLHGEPKPKPPVVCQAGDPMCAR